MIAHNEWVGMKVGLKKFSVGFMIVALCIGVIGLIVGTLFGVWRNNTSPAVYYVIVDVMNNTMVELPECDAPTMTIIRNITTDQISYQCGDLGKISEIVTLD